MAAGGRGGEVAHRDAAPRAHQAGCHSYSADAAQSSFGGIGPPHTTYDPLSPPSPSPHTHLLEVQHHILLQQRRQAHRYGAAETRADQGLQAHMQPAGGYSGRAQQQRRRAE